MCILRNLSYYLEAEVDPQLGAGDEMDLSWERELQEEIDNESIRQEEQLLDSSRCVCVCVCARTLACVCVDATL